ncbi:hypothetical protein FAVG1_08487 [Fusarium avenaceum]|nr:hypothetical protein FAVG1_08487 [Fusarium avenaceum]
MSQKSVLHLEFDPHCHDTYDMTYLIESESDFTGHMNCQDSNNKDNICCNPQYSDPPSPPWHSLSDPTLNLFIQELRTMYYEEVAIDLRSGTQYRAQWNKDWDQLWVTSALSIERDSIIHFFNKEFMLYMDEEVVYETENSFSLDLTGRYLYRTWHPLQRGGFIAKHMLIPQQLRMNLAQLSTYHMELSEMLSQSLNDPVSFNTCFDPMAAPPIKSFRNHGYLIRPLFKALYMVIDDQFEAYQIDLIEPFRQGVSKYKQKFQEFLSSNHTVLLVRTCQDSHLTSPVSFLPLFESGLALAVNRPDYEDGPEPTVVRVRLETALEFISELLSKEEAASEEAAQARERLEQEQETGCQEFIDRMIDHCQKFGIDSHTRSWTTLRRVRARLNNEAFEYDQVSPPWESLSRWCY